jgi:hypothetical protein
MGARWDIDYLVTTDGAVRSNRWNEGCCMMSRLIFRVAMVQTTCAALVLQSGCAPSSDTELKTTPRESQAVSIAVSGDEPSRPTSHAKALYMPVPGDFRPIYESDSANKSKQKWEEYYSWVTTFYRGNILAPGWSKRVNEILEGLRSERARDELRASLNELGRMLAAEWSKDNDVRKVSNSDLLSFGSRFSQAKDKEDGTGTVLRKEIAAIRAEIELRFKRQSP